jgi:hypothetical protein
VPTDEPLLNVERMMLGGPMKQPKPKTVKVECDVCGQDWKQHKPDAKGKVGLDECVRLLKVELAKPRPAWISQSSGITAYPHFYGNTTH